MTTCIGVGSGVAAPHPCLSCQVHPEFSNSAAEMEKPVFPLVQAGCSVTALDLSRHALSLCKNGCPDPDRVSLLIADTRQIPFRDESFEGIIASHIAGHLSLAGRRQLACEVRRLLIPAV